MPPGILCKVEEWQVTFQNQQQIPGDPWGLRHLQPQQTLQTGLRTVTNRLFPCPASVVQNHKMLIFNTPQYFPSCLVGLCRMNVYLFCT